MTCCWRFAFHSLHHFSSFDGFVSISNGFKSIEFLKEHIRFISEWIVFKEPVNTASSLIEFIDTTDKRIRKSIHIIITWFCHNSIARRTSNEGHSISATHQFIDC